MEPIDEDLRDVLVEWHDQNHQIYAVMFDHFGEKRRISLGRVVDVSDGEAVIADADADLRLPISTPSMRVRLQRRDALVRSVVMTWEDGHSAFVAVRKPLPPD